MASVLNAYEVADIGDLDPKTARNVLSVRLAANIFPASRARRYRRKAQESVTRLDDFPARFVQLGPGRWGVGDGVRAPRRGGRGCRPWWSR